MSSYLHDSSVCVSYFKDNMDPDLPVTVLHHSGLGVYSTRSSASTLETGRPWLLPPRGSLDLGPSSVSIGLDNGLHLTFSFMRAEEERRTGDPKTVTEDNRFEWTFG